MLIAMKKNHIKKHYVCCRLRIESGMVAMVQLMCSDLLNHGYMSWMPLSQGTDIEAFQKTEFKTLNHFVFKNCQISGKNVQEILKQNDDMRFPDTVKPHSR